MVIVPRTRGGTWLAALSAWLAACAGLWWALPVAPRAVIDDIAGEIDFSIDSARIYARRGLDPVIAVYDARRGVLVRLWNLDGEILCLEPRLDLCVWKPAGNASVPQLLDLASGRDEPVPWWSPDCKAVTHASPDGRFYAIAISDKVGSKTVWWDRHDGRSVAILQNLAALAVGIHGFWLTADADSNDLFVRAPASDRIVARIPRTSRWTGIDLTSDGSVIVLSSKLARIVDLKSGTILCDLPTNRDVVVLPDVPLAVTLYVENSQLMLTRWDIAAGAEVGRDVIALGSKALVRNASHDWPKNGILTMQTESTPAIVRMVLQSRLGALPMFSDLYLRRWVTFTFCDVRTASEIDDLTVSDTARPVPLISPDARTVAIHLPGQSRLSIWDLPPRKSLTHFAAGAAILALPVAFVAWRRQRKANAAA